MELNTQELLILIFIIIAIGSILSLLFKSAAKIIIAIVIISIMYNVGFNWLPEKAAEIKAGNTTVTEIASDIKNEVDESGVVNMTFETIDKTGKFVEENKDDWIESFKSLWQKLFPDKEEVNIINELEE